MHLNDGLTLPRLLDRFNPFGKTFNYPSNDLQSLFGDNTVKTLYDSKHTHINFIVYWFAPPPFLPLDIWYYKNTYVRRYRMVQNKSLMTLVHTRPRHFRNSSTLIHTKIWTSSTLVHAIFRTSSTPNFEPRSHSSTFSDIVHVPVYPGTDNTLSKWSLLDNKGQH